MWAVLVSALSPIATADSVSPEDLFLPPSSIPDDFYTTHSFTFGSNTTVTEFINATDIGGSLVGVHILPILKPNPSPSRKEGEYTSADLAAINPSNFTTYFLQQPGTDYFVDLTSNQIRIDYRAPGQYFVKVDAVGASGAFSQIFHDHVDDFFAEDPQHGATDKGGVSRAINDPSADLILVSDGDPNDTGFLWAAKKQLDWNGEKYTKVTSLADVKAAIQKASEAKGRKISVVLIGHGFGPGNKNPQGGIKIGTEYITNKKLSDATEMSPADFQSMIDQWVNSIEFWSCYTIGDATFGMDIKNSIGSVAGFSTTVSAAPPLFFNGYFDTGAGATKGEVSDVPEPASIVLLLMGGIVLAFHNQRGR
jgi:hypothetical protein